MKILVACEFSGTVRDALIEKGHDAWSCDILPTEGKYLDNHYMTDVRDVLEKDWDGQEWDMIVAFPPCTHLAVSGAKHFVKKIADGRQQDGIDFFMLFANHKCPRIAIENPVGIMSTKYRKPDQIIQPYEYGDPSKKTTCLWLKGLPKLVPTNIVEPNIKTYKDGSKFSADYGWSSNKRRGQTYKGIANAMAEQWSSPIN